MKQTYDQALPSMRKIADVAEKNGFEREDVNLGVRTARAVKPRALKPGI